MVKCGREANVIEQSIQIPARLLIVKKIITSTNLVKE